MQQESHARARAQDLSATIPDDRDFQVIATAWRAKAPAPAPTTPGACNRHLPVPVGVEHPPRYYRFRNTPLACCPWSHLHPLTPLHSEALWGEEEQEVCVNAFSLLPSPTSSQCVLYAPAMTLHLVRTHPDRTLLTPVLPIASANRRAARRASLSAAAKSPRAVQSADPKSARRETRPGASPASCSANVL